MKKAAKAQQKLASRLLLKQDVRKTTLIAGADFSYHKQKRLISAIVVVLKFPELEIIEVAEEVREVRIPEPIRIAHHIAKKLFSEPSV